MDNEAATDRFFHSFALNPKIVFETQRVSEKVLIMVRSHPITQIPWIFNSLVFLILLLILDFFFAPMLTLMQVLTINIFVLVFVFSYIWFNYLNWFFNVGIITNERVVDVDFHNIIYKEINIARLDKVEDITSKGAGYFGSLFNYGHLFIQTAGSEVNLEFHSIPDPSGVAHIVNGLLEK